MHLVTYKHKDPPAPEDPHHKGSRIAHGVLVEGGIVQLGEGSLRHLLNDGIPTRVAGVGIDLDDVELLPPVHDSAKVFGIGLNYRSHREESGRTPMPDAHPTVFMKTCDSHVGDGQRLIKPAMSNCYDYEGELAVVISRRCYRVSEKDALAFVAGYSAYNDGSLRDWQRHTSQWGPGKGFYQSSAFGPTLTTTDEVGDLSQQTITTRVNGEVRQHSSLGNLIFDVPSVISYISTFTPLSAGDVITTGTPAGVGASMNPPCFLQVGDVVEVEVSRVGLLRNTVAAEE